MIVDRRKLREDLFGLVGFYQTSNPEYPLLAECLLESRSGLYFNDAHSLLESIENIDQSIKNFAHYKYPDYTADNDANGIYKKGSKVAFNGVNYEYVNDSESKGGNPPTDEDYWSEIDELSDYLIKSVYSGIDKMIDDWMNYKKVRSVVKSIYDRILLFSGEPDYDDIVRGENEFVGLKIRQKKGESSLVTIINKIGHHFEGNFNGLNVLLYHSSQQEPLTTFVINHNKSKSSVWSNINEDNILRYESDLHDVGGDFYLGYRQSQLLSLGGRAIKMRIIWNEMPDSKYHKWNEYYKQWSNFIFVTGFSVDESVIDDGFDPAEVSESYTENYGLNLNITTKCDIGNAIAMEEDLFESCLKQSVAMKLLSSMAYNTRGSNNLANQLKNEAKKELFHSKGVYGTVYDNYQSSVKSLSFDLSGLGESCFPCDDGSEDIIAGLGTLS